MTKPRSSRFVLGKQTRAFDVLDDDLIIVQYDRPVSEGAVLAVTGMNGPDQLTYKPLNPFKAPQDAADKGFKAFKPTDEGFYLCDGIEWVPRRVKRYVRYSSAEGFTPVDRDTVTAEFSRRSAERAAEATNSIAWPALTGTPAQVAFASKLRLTAFKKISGLGLYELETRLLSHTSSSWFIKRKMYTRDQWIQSLAAQSASET